MRATGERKRKGRETPGWGGRLCGDIDRDSELTWDVIGAAIRVHRELGPGLLESVCRECLVHELQCRGLSYRVEVPVPIRYRGIAIEARYRVDHVVADRVIVELKAVRALEELHTAQPLTYMRLLRRRLGLLINFNSVLLKHGIRRIVFDESGSPPPR